MVQIGDTFKDGSAVFKVKKFGADGALVGSVTWYAGAGTPENYLLCDGSAVSRTNYADLFAVIGTIYGAGDGSTTFNLPLLTDGRFIEGSGTAGQYIAPGLPNITGTNGMGNTANSGAFYGYYAKPGWGEQHNDWIRTGFDASRSSAIYGRSTTVQPNALTMRPIIKYI